MCKYWVNQHLIVVNSNSTSMNKIIVMAFMTVKVARNLYSMEKCKHSEINNSVNVFKMEYSEKSNQTFKNKSITKIYQIENK